MISAEYASPAAARLALRLTFGVYVMGPQLVGSTLLQETSQRAGLMKSLRAYIDHTINTKAMKTKQYQHQEPADLDIHARECCAMFLCLFSVVSCAEDTEVDAQFLPHTHAALLRLIASVICPVEFPSSPEHLLSPYLKLDTAQVILLTWGKTIPWSWCVWADPRIAYAEIIGSMSSTWLFHIGGVSNDAECDPQFASAASWEEELTAALSLNPTAATIAITRILNCAVSALLMAPPAHFPPHCLDVIYRCCWAAAQLFRASVNVADAVAIQLCNALCRIFILLQQDNAYNAKDQILEALSSVQAEVLRSVMKDLCKDAKVNVAIALESRISHLSRYIDHEAGRADLCHQDLSGIRQLLQFNTLTWHHGIQTGISVPVWTSFLRGLVNWLASVLPESEAAINLRDALICALATFALLDEEGRKQSWDDEIVWNIAINSRAADLTTACALSSYISATIRRSRCSPLAIAESWNYLRDALLLILTHQFFNIEEPLAILICPSICQALMHLLRDSGDGPVQYMLSSPWSINLCAALQDLAEVADCQGDNYRAYLHARAMPFASALLEHMRAVLLNDHQQHDLPTADIRLLIVGIHTVPHTTLVLEHRREDVPSDAA
ncbi:uncharacterized protein LAESUDRAFT_139739 [Laetiporus sulphureus 93-53]|uniref:Uncharacterized protein n=1 Tax=Laetiporus sulphureus 93-53 TaxID=1314785 RepID=A0A165EE19_9APHY|nr:uncharacterized protein LAESUDRAFT_139739 [Laetiporus sulphureus 93-53]KZT06838.1 hypothetical protein LAESUDRAFT_139739 [Laetiporus sulphureus 93-53]